MTEPHEELGRKSKRSALRGAHASKMNRKKSAPARKNRTTPQMLPMTSSFLG